jgi:hypothetical protein
MKNICSLSATLSAWLCPVLLVSLLATTGPGHAQATPAALSPLRPPSVPLVTHDPYFSIWSPADRLTDADTVHWTGKPHRLTGLVRIDGRTFRVLGNEPAQVPALPQVGLEVLPTRTICSFEGSGVHLTLTFLTPALPEDLDVLSRPVTYLTFEVRSTDSAQHTVAFYLDAAAELTVNEPRQSVVWTRADTDQLAVLKLGSQDQRVLARKGDDLRIDWGHFYLAAPQDGRTSAHLLPANTARTAFASGSEFPELKLAMAVAAEDAPVAALAFPPTEVGVQPVSRWLMLAYDDLYSIRYFSDDLRPYWRRNGTDAAGLLAQAATDYLALLQRCKEFDAQLLADLRTLGGEPYARLCALAYRQTLAGNKIVADAHGQPLMFSKENFSNGCIGTVDVSFPQAPFFLVLSPALTKAMLVPVLDYATSPRWPYPYAPHDLGTYPHATGQVYGMGGSDGDRMPVEECGNMLIMLAALARFESNADFAKPYWPMLNQWADYLVQEGLDPRNQLCSADMFGHMPSNANLALKAILAIGGFAQLCELADRPDDARRYLAIARDYARQWLELARDDGRTRLAYHQPGSWSMKHNLIWDRVLGLNLFPAAVGDAEIAWYLKVQNRYGLPVDNRTETSLIDWALWSIALARQDADFQALLDPIYRYAHQTPDRVPLSDWFITTNAQRQGFQARPVVGGLFIKMLAHQPTWTRWAVQPPNTSGPWAPISIGAPPVEVVPTARTGRVTWRFTFDQPPDDWFQPGFDDSAWREGAGGFGTEGTPGAIIGTEWNTPNIWLRREFTWPDHPVNNPRLLLIYDEDPEIYLNGQLAAKLSGWATSYEEADLNPAALATLRPGRNLLAVRASQTYGGQSIDVGLAEDAPPLPVRKLLDHPVGDTSICLGPDGHVPPANP